MELKHFFRIVKARLGLIVVVTLLAAGAGLWISTLFPATYQASTSLLVNAGSSSSTTYNDVLASEQLATTYAQLLTKRPVIEAAAQELGLDANELKKKVHVQLVPNTTLIELTADDHDPLMAAEIANQVVTAFKGSARDLGIRDRDLIVVEPPSIPTAPERSPVIFVVLGTLTGLMIGLGLAFLLDYLSDAIESDSEIKGTLGVTCLGTVLGASRSEQAGQLIALTQPHAPVAEAYRSIRTQLHLANEDGSLKKLLITDAESSSGKTALVANLGVMLAQAGSRVVLIDANARLPMLHRFFGMSNAVGLTDWLTGHTQSLEACLLKTSIDNLQIISSGSLPPDPSALLGSARMDRLLAEVAQSVDWIILDSPAVLDVADAIELSRKVDRVVLVVEAGRTSRQKARQACEALQEAGANILGAVMTRTKVRKLTLRRPIWLRERRPRSRIVADAEPAAVR